MFRGGTFSKPASLAIALATGTLDDTMTGNLGNLEVKNGAGYLRQVLPPGNANWSFTVDGQGSSGNVDNLSAITFPQCVNSGWGTVTHLAIMDSGGYGAGNMLFHGALNVSKTVTVGDTLSISAGNLDCYLS